MKTIFPEPILNLPQADILIKGVSAYLSQGDNHQIIFMVFTEDVDLPEHSHASQVGVVLEGKIDLIIDGVKNTYQKGDRFFIPDGVIPMYTMKRTDFLQYISKRMSFGLMRTKENTLLGAMLIYGRN